MSLRLNHTHCSECGTQFGDATVWPRQCITCSNMKWDNPVPVALVLQPIQSLPEENGHISMGLAIARRAIEPGAGQWALIGGFMDKGDEGAEGGAAREFIEETGLQPAAPPRIVYTRMTPSGQLLCVCVVDTPMCITEYRKGVCCAENLELGVLWRNDQRELAFPLHREAIQRWFNRELIGQRF